MYDSCTIWLPDAKSLHLAGASLAQTLYRTDDLTIGLHGELGAGKTTFVQGLLRRLGVEDDVVSPTYALEQRYKCHFRQLKHIDLYRLNEKQAHDLLAESERENGLRIIEWADRSTVRCDIVIEISEPSSGEGRTLTVRYRDIRLPTQDEITRWRSDVSLPEHICRHCDTVADFSEHLAKELMQRGTLLRPDALRKAAQIHDLLRFIDFRPGGSHVEMGPEPKEWNLWRTRFAHQGHEAACAIFLQEYGYPELASIVAVHGLSHPPSDTATIEQKLLYYADKRVLFDRVVSLEERFADFRERYNDGEQSEQNDRWYAVVKALEQDLQLG